jgi:hypothetical protein
MGIDDESSHPELCSEVAGGVTRNLVCLFREPDAGNLPVRFDEREQETELRQTGLRRVTRKHPNSHREAKATAPVLDSTLSRNSREKLPVEVLSRGSNLDDLQA